MRWDVRYATTSIDDAWDIAVGPGGGRVFVGGFSSVFPESDVTLAYSTY
jgi:hypothetical protein